MTINKVWKYCLIKCAISGQNVHTHTNFIFCIKERTVLNAYKHCGVQAMFQCITVQ